MRLLLQATLSLLSYFFPLFAQEQSQLLDEIIAKVNHHIILKSQLEEQFLGAQSTGVNLTQCDILKSIIYNKILVAKAELDSIPLSETEVEANLSNRMQYVMAQVGSQAQVEALYGKSITALKDELRESVRDQMLVDRMQASLLEDLDVTPRDVQLFYESIPSHERPYYSTEVSLAQIVCFPTPSAHAHALAESQALAIRRKLLAGENFEALAQKFSMDPSVVRNSGALGFVNRGELDPDYEAAALNLSLEEVSLPVRTHFGYHLIELLEIKGNRYNSRHILIVPEPETIDFQRTRLLLDSLRREILASHTGFEAAAKQYSEDSQTALSGGFFSRTDGQLYISVEELDPLLFFTVDSMEVGQLSPPLRYTSSEGKEGFRLLYYKEKIPPHEARLPQDYLKLRTALLQKEQKEIIDSWMKDVYKELFIFISSGYQHCEVYKMSKH